MKIKTRYFLGIILLLEGFANAGTSILPLGKRQYNLESKNPFDPVQISPLGPVRHGMAIMKDPILLGQEKLSNAGSSKTSEAIPKQLKKISRMVFDQVAVKGKYLVPRVSFDRPTLDVGPSEEVQAVDYRRKIRDSEEILKNFDW